MGADLLSIYGNFILREHCLVCLWWESCTGGKHKLPRLASRIDSHQQNIKKSTCKRHILLHRHR